MGNQYLMRKPTITFPRIHLKSWLLNKNHYNHKIYDIIIFIESVFPRWAAYVAGTILVLMREMNVRFEDSISILVTTLY